MASVISIRVESENNTTIKVVSADRKTIKMLSFLRSAYNTVKQSYKSDDRYFADYNLARPGVYVLISDDNKKIYIGQSDSVQDRLNTHYANQDKTEYWVQTMTFVSDGGNALNISQIKYIESELLRLAKKAAKVVASDDEEVLEIKNIQNANIPNMSVNDEIIAKNFLEEILIFTKALGIGYFEEKVVIEQAMEASEMAEVFTFKTANCDAKMVIKGDSFIVLKGSIARKDNTPSCHQFIKDKKELLIQSGQLVLENNFYKAGEDISFDSASTAAAVMAGSSQNGRVAWKNTDGKTLKDLGL